MFKPKHLCQLLLVCAIAGAGLAHATEPTAASEKDPVRATLLESKEKNRGVTISSAGASIAMVVTALDDRYVVGRSQQSSRIVVRLDRIDSVSAAF